MNSKFLQFNEQANLMITDAALHAAVVTSALALAISSTSHLPTTEVDNPTAYFNLQLTPGINVIVSEWCENMVIDPRAAVEQTRVFYLIRYTSAYPCSRVLYSANGDFFDTITGVNAFVPPELHAFLDGLNKSAILSLAMSASEILLSNKGLPAMENFFTDLFLPKTDKQKRQEEEADEMMWETCKKIHIENFNENAKKYNADVIAKSLPGTEKINGKSVDIGIYGTGNDEFRGKIIEKFHVSRMRSVGKDKDDVPISEGGDLISLWRDPKYFKK